MSRHTSFSQIPITIISLKNTWRKKLIVKACEKLKLDYVFFDAIDGEALSEDEINKVYNEKNTLSYKKMPLTRGEIGCALSHLGVYKKMLKERIKTMLILEDDTILGEYVKQGMQTVHYLPKNWDILFLGYSIYLKKNHYARYIFPIKKLPFNFKIAKPIVTLGGAYAYVINQKAAKKILNMIKPLSRPLDDYTGDFKALNLYMTIPELIKVNYDAPSHLAADRSRLAKIYNYNPVSIKIGIRHSAFFYMLRKIYYVFKERKQNLSSKINNLLGLNNYIK